MSFFEGLHISASWATLAPDPVADSRRHHGLPARQVCSMVQGGVIAVGEDAGVWDLGGEVILQPVNFGAGGKRARPCALAVVIDAVEGDDVDGGGVG
jgi:hypothetical protein